MKNILLLLGIAGFYTATAQQKDVFDINEYLLKDKPGVNLREKAILKPGLTFNISNNKKPEDSYLLPNGDKVVALPQDRMPCVVPSLKEYTRTNISKYDGSLLENLPGNKLKWAKYPPLHVLEGSFETNHCTSVHIPAIK